MQDKDKCLYLEIAFYCILFVVAFMTTTTFIQSNLFRPEVKQVDSYEYPAAPPKVAKKEAVSGPSEAYMRRSCKGSYQCSSLASALVYEAMGEPVEGAVAIAYVILERVEQRKWGDTIPAVLAAKRRGICQFSYKCKLPKAKPTQEDWTRGYTIAYNVLQGEIENPIGDADHFHTTAVNPVWDNNMEYVATIGKHEFYRSE